MVYALVLLLLVLCWIVADIRRLLRRAARDRDHEARLRALRRRDKVTQLHEEIACANEAAAVIVAEIHRAIDEGAMVPDAGWLES